MRVIVLMMKKMMTVMVVVPSQIGRLWSPWPVGPGEGVWPFPAQSLPKF